jgi:hypothetical protein
MTYRIINSGGHEFEIPASICAWVSEVHWCCIVAAIAPNCLRAMLTTAVEQHLFQTNEVFEREREAIGVSSSAESETC